MVRFISKKILFDTNVYGQLIIGEDVEIILGKILLQKDCTYYGIRNLIRKELRDIPKGKKYFGKNVRVFALDVYDVIVGRHELSMSSKIINLAEKYFEYYVQLGGNFSKNELITDMRIVACASIKKWI